MKVSDPLLGFKDGQCRIFAALDGVENVEMHLDVRVIHILEDADHVGCAADDFVFAWPQKFNGQYKTSHFADVAGFIEEFSEALVSFNCAQLVFPAETTPTGAVDCPYGNTGAANDFRSVADMFDRDERVLNIFIIVSQRVAVRRAVFGARKKIAKRNFVNVALPRHFSYLHPGDLAKKKGDFEDGDPGVRSLPHHRPKCLRTCDAEHGAQGVRSEFESLHKFPVWFLLRVSVVQGKSTSFLSFVNACYTSDMNKRKVFIWALYDFANSIVMIAFFLYFSQWLVIEKGVNDFWFNIILTVSSLCYLFGGPVLGSIADKTGNKIRGIRFTTIFSGFFYLLTGIVAVAYPDEIVLAIVFFVLATSVYLLSFIYYNSFLDDLAPEGERATVSGWGLFGNYIGQIAAVLIALPFATGVITLWGDPGRAQAFIPATLIFIILSMPLLITFRDKNKKVVKINLKEEYRGVWNGFVKLIKTPSIGRFFLAYFFFNDAVLTASNNFPIYLERVFSASDTFKSYILLGILITSAISSPVSGWIADKIGLRKTLLWILGGWIIIFPLMAFVPTLTGLFVLTIIMGLLFGSVWTVTRAMVISYTPPGSLNTSYTYFTLMERFATLIGPLSWGLIVAVGPQTENWNYRGAVCAMALFVLIGLLIARKLPSDHKVTA
jgi:UMF1 family MFS transporter